MVSCSSATLLRSASNRLSCATSFSGSCLQRRAALADGAVEHRQIRLAARPRFSMSSAARSFCGDALEALDRAREVSLGELILGERSRPAPDWRWRDAGEPAACSATGVRLHAVHDRPDHQREPSRRPARRTPATTGSRPLRAAVFGSASMAAESFVHTCGGGTCGSSERLAARITSKSATTARHARTSTGATRATPAAALVESSHRRSRRSGPRSPGSSSPVPAHLYRSTSRAASCAPCAPATSTCLPRRRAASPLRCARTLRRRAARTRRGIPAAAGQSPARGRCG